MSVRRAIVGGLLITSLLLASCGSGSYSEEQIADALAVLQPPDTGVSWGDWMVDCALDAGFSGTLSIDPLGSVESEPLTPRDDEIIDECAERSAEIFTFPEIEDKRLELTALYELQERAAACVREELGLDPQLPTLETYVDSGGDWNMYDNATPRDQAEWIEWNQTCPQDLWYYYEP